MLWWLICAGTALAAWWLLASLVASWWIYDLSPLTRWTWLAEWLPTAALDGSRPVRLLNIHSGLDDTTLILREIFPEATIRVVDLYDPQMMTEPSIGRARQACPPVVGTEPGTPQRLPVADRSADAVLLLLAAHELRQPAEREALFGEAVRALAEGGRVVLAEHARDGWNFLAFGPGFGHFLPYGEWSRVARLTDLHVVHQGRITPFIRTLVLERGSHA
jgi:SAM-dependent methyltransferase